MEEAERSCAGVSAEADSAVWVVRIVISHVSVAIMSGDVVGVVMAGPARAWLPSK